MTPTKEAAAQTVFLVDDDQSFLKSMCRLLASEGIEARAFDKPEEFLAHAAAHPVPVVVTDIRMKGVTGLEILARMCAISPRPRVIVITGRDDLAARTTAMQIGPVAFLVKPFEDALFLTAVREALAQAGGVKTVPRESRRVSSMRQLPDVECLKESPLFLWRPRGVLNQGKVNAILAFLTEQETKYGRPYDRFTDLSQLDAVDLTFKYVLQVALYRRLARLGQETIKSAFFVTNPAVARYIKLHAMVTDHSPLLVALFDDRKAAAEWLGVAAELLAEER